MSAIISLLNKLGYKGGSFGDLQKSLEEDVKLHPESTASKAILAGINGLGTFTDIKRVKREHLPALRSLILKQFPDLKQNPHGRAKIETFAAETLGGKLGGYLDDKNSVGAFSNAVNNLSTDEGLQASLKLLRNLSLRTEVEGSPGYGNQVEPFEKKIAGKQTLAAYFRQAGTDSFDTPIQVKTQSEVNADYWNYWPANPEHGIYDGVYLQDAQWEKDIRFNGETGDASLPRSGYDQLYFPSWDLNPAYENSQPVMMELTDMFEDKLYEIQVSKFEGNAEFNDPLKDLRVTTDPIMDMTSDAHFIPAQPLQGDFKGFHQDPDGPWMYTASYNNKVGLTDARDAYVNIYQKSEFIPPVLDRPKEQTYKMWEQDGFQPYTVSAP